MKRSIAVRQLLRRIDSPVLRRGAGTVLRPAPRGQRAIVRGLPAAWARLFSAAVGPPLGSARRGMASEAAGVAPTPAGAAAPAGRASAKKKGSASALARGVDLTNPQTWYPLARMMKRKVIFHGGPTNSGKTHHALQRFRQASPEHGGGVYLGPLRLLALEVYTDTNEKGVYCSLITGNERKEVPFAHHSSRTVEMAELHTPCDVAVLDEIQMIADPDRGHAWTRALLGLRCRELHVAGGMEAEPLVREMMKRTGDDYELRTYERLTPLFAEEEALGSYREVKAGDAVVAFSRQAIEEIRDFIETNTPHRCAVIYGQLPSETRATMARRFNDEDSGYDVLVASDAVGMGLNLNIRRVILDSVSKWNGVKMSQIDRGLIKQIAGRAGRRSSPYSSGLATTLRAEDLDYLRECLREDVSPLAGAGIFPTKEHVEAFSLTMMDSAAEPREVAPGGAQAAQAAAAFGADPTSRLDLSRLFTRFIEMSKLRGQFFLCKFDQTLILGAYLQQLELSLADRFVFTTAPVSLMNRLGLKYLYHYAEQHAANRPVRVNVKLPHRAPKYSDQMQDLCVRHNIIDMYLWLAQRFRRTFVDTDQAKLQKQYLVDLISTSLADQLPRREPRKDRAKGPEARAKKAGQKPPRARRRKQKAPRKRARD